MQITGPLTAQLALSVVDHSKIRRPLGTDPSLASHVFQLILARATAVVRRLRLEGVEPVFFFDEPAFAVFNRALPAHLMLLQELKLAVQTLRKEGATVGVHCCSDADWASILSTEPDFLSIDAWLTFDTLLGPAGQPLLEAHLKAGRRLSLGVIDTRGGMDETQDKVLIEALKARSKSLGKKLIEESLFTPACGLALHAIPDTEMILERLRSFCRHL